MKIKVGWLEKNWIKEIDWSGGGGGDVKRGVRLHPERQDGVTGKKEMRKNIVGECE